MPSCQRSAPAVHVRRHKIHETSSKLVPRTLTSSTPRSKARRVRGNTCVGASLVTRHMSHVTRPTSHLKSHRSQVAHASTHVTVRRHVRHQSQIFHQTTRFSLWRVAGTQPASASHHAHAQLRGNRSHAPLTRLQRTRSRHFASLFKLGVHPVKT